MIYDIIYIIKNNNITVNIKIDARIINVQYSNIINELKNNNNMECNNKN